MAYRALQVPSLLTLYIFSLFSANTFVPLPLAVSLSQYLPQRYKHICYISLNRKSLLFVCVCILLLLHPSHYSLLYIIFLNCFPYNTLPVLLLCYLNYLVKRHPLFLLAKALLHICTIFSVCLWRNKPLNFFSSCALLPYTSSGYLGIFTENLTLIFILVPPTFLIFSPFSCFSRRATSLYSCHSLSCPHGFHYFAFPPSTFTWLFPQFCLSLATRQHTPAGFQPPLKFV